MPDSCPPSTRLTPPTPSVIRALLALSLLASAVAGPALAQDQSGARQGSSNPIVGRWELAEPMSGGGVTYQYDEFLADGTWRQTALSKGGRYEGLRSQKWGRYSVQTSGNNVLITFNPTGFAPTQACTPGVGCQAMNPPPQTFTNRYTLVDANHLRSNDQQHLLTGRVAQIPAALTSQLPQTHMFPAPPTISGGGRSGGGSGYTPMPRPAGVGGTCDNLQQQRICNLNDGYLYTDQRGCQVCSSGAGH